MRLDGLWRYPVKSLGGEALDAAELTDDGIPGDRVVHVRNDRGPLTGRTRHGLLTLPATTGPDGVPLSPATGGTAPPRTRWSRNGPARTPAWPATTGPSGSTC
jgi:uncharacterized protein YcbX